MSPSERKLCVQVSSFPKLSGKGENELVLPSTAFHASHLALSFMFKIPGRAANNTEIHEHEMWISVDIKEK